MEIFALLLDCGLPFADAIEMSFESQKEIFEFLEKGGSFSQLILKQKSKRMKRLGVLMETFDMRQAIQLDERLNASQTALRQSLIRQSGYPLFIMAFATALIWFFSVSIVPDMCENGTNPLLELLKTASLLFWLIFAAGVGAVMWMLKGPSWGSTLHDGLFSFSIFRHLCSMECASLFECTQASGLSTRQIYAFVHRAGCFPFCEMLWKRWKKKMERGISFQQCIETDRHLDPLFIRFFRLGSSTARMKEMMEAYQKSATIRFEKKLKKLSNILLYTAYAFTGVLALSLYQIMLEPLAMLETM